jgi:hemoglobin
MSAGSEPRCEERQAVRRNGARTTDSDIYSRVRSDAELGPVFNDAVHDWPPHLKTIDPDTGGM